MTSTKTFSPELRIRIDSFVEEIHAVVKIAALEAVHGALTAELCVATHAISPRRTAGRTARLIRRKSGGKRTPEAVMETAATVHDYVGENAGRRMEGIAEGLGVASGGLELPVQKLLAAKQIKTQGRKRGTRYFAW